MVTCKSWPWTTNATCCPNGLKQYNQPSSITLILMFQISFSHTNKNLSDNIITHTICKSWHKTSWHKILEHLYKYSKMPTWHYSSYVKSWGSIERWGCQIRERHRSALVRQCLHTGQFVNKDARNVSWPFHTGHWSMLRLVTFNSISNYSLIENLYCYWYCLSRSILIFHIKAKSDKG